MSSFDHNVRSGFEDGMIAQYLLGELSEEEGDSLEEKLFTQGCYERLFVVEEDLIEAYFRGELGARERERFESHFLASPERRKRVEFTRNLFKAIEEININQSVSIAPARVSTPWWSAVLAAPGLASAVRQLSLATAGLIVLIGGIWLVIENQKLRSQSEKLRSELTEARQQQLQLAEQLARKEQSTVKPQTARDQLTPSQPTPSPILAYFFTVNNSSRGDGVRSKLSIPSGVHQLHLTFQFPATESYRGYVASLHTPEGDQIASRRVKLIAPGKVTLTLPSTLLATNDYILTLKGLTAGNVFEEIADYQFTVLKK